MAVTRSHMSVPPFDSLRTSCKCIAYGTVTCSFGNRCSESLTDHAVTTYDDADQALTALLTDIARFDPDLASVVRA